MARTYAQFSDAISGGGTVAPLTTVIAQMDNMKVPNLGSDTLKAGVLYGLGKNETADGASRYYPQQALSIQTATTPTAAPVQKTGVKVALVNDPTASLRDLQPRR